MVNVIYLALILMIEQGSEEPSAPIADRSDFEHNDHGVRRSDPYFWLKNRDDPKVIKYLKDENKYTNHVFEKTKKLQTDLVGRSKEESNRMILLIQFHGKTIYIIPDMK